MLGIATGVVVALLVTVYFIATSAWFFQSIVLPRVGREINATVTVESASISPFSSVSLSGLKVQAGAGEPILTVASIALRYHLMDIIGGHINVDEVAISTPVIVVTEDATGKRNLDPILEKLAAKKAEPSQPKAEAKPAKPLQLDLKKFALSNAKVRYTKADKAGGQMTAEVNGINLGLENLGNGKSGMVNLAADLQFEQKQGTTNNTLQAKLSGQFQVALDNQLMPATLKGGTQLAVSQALGTFQQLSGLTVNLASDLTPTELKNVSVQITQSGKGLGTLAISGPLNLAKLEGKLRGDITAIDKQVLNLVGKAFNVDFNSTTISSSGQVELANGGKSIQIQGAVSAARLSVTQLGQSTPELDVNIAYDLAVDRVAETATVRSFNLAGLQNKKEFIHGSLTKPMTVGWGKTGTSADESVFTLTLDNLNLADWKAFAAGSDPVGLASMKLNVLSRGMGKQIHVDLQAGLNNFSVKSGPNRLSLSSLEVQLLTDVDDLSKVKLSKFSLAARHQNQTALTLDGSGQMDSKTQDLILDAKVQAFLEPLVKMAGVPNVQVKSGVVRFDGHVVQKPLPTQAGKPTPMERSVTGKLTVEDLSVTLSQIVLDQYAVSMDCDLLLKDTQAEIRKLAGNLRQQNTPGGAFEIKGHYDLQKQTGDASLLVTDLNQNALRPFLAAALGDKQLQTVSISLQTESRFDAKGNASVAGDLSLAKLVVKDPKQSLPNQPLEAKVKLDAAMDGKVFTLRQVRLNLTPTKLAANQLDFSGSVNLTDTNALTGALKLRSDGLDFTSYYDLLGKQNAAAGATPESAPEPVVAATPANQEPPKVAALLAITNFTFDTSIARIYLREIAISNLVTGLRLNRGVIQLDPCQLSLNGVPVSAKVWANLGVDGYEYELALKAQGIPAEPIVNSFSPENSSIAKGDLIADVRIKGAGVTGRSLQKNLTGQVLLNFTNANVVVSSKRIKPLLETLAAVLRTPSLTRTPLDHISANLTLGQSKINIQSFVAHSPLLIVESRGVIPIAEVLTNSPLNQPVDIWLARGLAKNLSLAPANPTDTYVLLPQFVQLEGTLGAPTMDKQKALEKLAVATATTVATAQAKKLLGDKLGDKNADLINKFGGLLGGSRQPATTNATTAPQTDTVRTNPPAQQLVPALMDEFFKRVPKKK